ncbi:ATP-grasp domain-containing protein [Chloroflexota bacterium]
MTEPPLKPRIGFAYDSPPEEETIGVESVASEYEDARTIDWMYGCLSHLGEVIRLPWGRESLVSLVNNPVDVIFNITEAGGGRNRESFVPAAAEAMGIPCTGTDAVGLGISLEKYLTKVIASHHGIPTPPFLMAGSIEELDRRQAEIESLGYPLFVKPVTGGSSMGIRHSARTTSFQSLRDETAWILDFCRDAALIEAFVPGREFTVGLLEGDSLNCLPVAELVFNGGNPDSFYSYDMKSVHRKQVVCPAEIPEELSLEMEDYSRRIFNALGCRDLARVDFRLGPDGTPMFIEINPLPGLSPFYSVFITQAEQAGIGAEDLIGQLVGNAISRRAK